MKSKFLIYLFAMIVACTAIGCDDDPVMSEGDDDPIVNPPPKP